MSIFQELKRRNVFRVGFAYVVTSWLLLQFADIVLQNIAAPNWVIQVFMLALALGFPIALFFAWAYELTPEGLEKEKDVDRGHSIASQTGRRLDFIIIGLLAIGLGIFVFLYFSGPGKSGADGGIVSSGRPAIAVLPFTSRSADPDNVFFADGIHDDLLTMLANIGSIKVISRTSVMQYRDTRKNMREIG